MKRPVWDTVRKGIEELTEAIESYCYDLDEKKKAVILPLLLLTTLRSVC